MPIEKEYADVSIIIPTKNRPESLLQAVRSIQKQRTWPKEIIIVDQSNLEGTADNMENEFSQSKRAPKIIVLYRPKLGGLTAARNLGFEYASGQIIQFMDDDSCLEKRYFESLLPVFDNPNIAGVCGRIIEPKTRFHPLAKYFQRLFFLGELRQKREEWYHTKYPKSMETNIMPGVAAYRRKVLEEFKFNEKLTGGSMGEDVEFSYRAHKVYKFEMSPRPKIRHLPETRGRPNPRQQARGKFLFYKTHSQTNLPKGLAKHATLAWLFTGFILHALASFDPKRLRGTLEGVWICLGRTRI